MSNQRWDYATGLSVTLEHGKLLWENWRRGDESGIEQSIADFIAKGPAVFTRDIPKPILREILAAMGNPAVTWIAPEGKEPVITLDVLGVPVKFYDDPYLEAHDNLGVHDIIVRMGKNSEEFWRTKKLGLGHIVDDTTLMGFTFKAGSELLLHENGNIFLGTLAHEGHFGKIAFAAGSVLVFYEDGTIESGTLAGKTEIDGLKYYGQIGFFADGRVASGSLAKAAVIHGQECGVGPIYFAADGSINSHC